MMAQLGTNNAVVDHLLRPAAAVLGRRRVDLEAVPIARTTVQLATANVVGVGPLQHHLDHLARRPLVPNGVPQLGTSQSHTVLLNCETEVGQSMVTVAWRPKLPTTWSAVL